MFSIPAKRADKLIDLLPLVHMVTRTAPVPHIAIASAMARHPRMRRLAPGLSTAVSVGLALMAIASTANELKKRSVIAKGITKDGEPLRASVT